MKMITPELEKIFAEVGNQSEVKTLELLLNISRL